MLMVIVDNNNDDTNDNNNGRFDYAVDFERALLLPRYPRYVNDPHQQQPSAGKKR